MLDQLQTMLHVFSGIILLLLLASTFPFSKGEDNTSHCFFCLVSCLLLVLLTKILEGMVLGHSWFYLPTLILHTLNYSFSVLGLTSLHFYTCSFFQYYRNKKVLKMKGYYLVTSAILILYWTLGTILGLFTQKAEGTFVFTPLYLTTQVALLFIIIPDLFLTFHNSRNTGKAPWVWILFLLITFLGRLLDLRFGLSLVFPAATLTVLFIYNTLQKEMEYALEDQALTLTRQEMELQETRQKIMMSQIQPHFLYNVLNTICVLCRRDPEKAATTTEEFAKYLRLNLDSLSKDMPVTFDEELEHTRIYLGLEMLRFGDLMKVEWDIQARSFLLPVLSLQPIVENAVRHGICQKEDGGTVRISAFAESDHYTVTVEDDGVGFDTSLSIEKDGKSHIGLSDTRRRIEMQTGGTLHVESEKGKGTKVTITVPRKTRGERSGR